MTEESKPAASKPRKKVVRAAPAAEGRSTAEPGADGAADRTWKATPEAKGRARTKRIIAGVLWLVAIALQAFAIFGLLNTPARTRIAQQFDWNSGVQQGADGSPSSRSPAGRSGGSSASS
ncbi:hypothetical protein [Leucobacter soli]|uniref:hypothetical protein n=1 Tax=Leucobacter soli TaxID=2812850 RepID=UPI00360CE0B5